MKFSPNDLIQGALNQREQKETPNSFGTAEGAAQVNPTSDLAKSQRRLAGQRGARAVEMLTNPEEAVRTQEWMSQFGLSNQGMQWNAAKMGLPQ
tara:strand:- start:111 stop:392 length:282 start_codon:yes stop_codon:yes gene_type:complete